MQLRAFFIKIILLTNTYTAKVQKETDIEIYLIKNNKHK